MELFFPYKITLLIVGLTGVLLFVQILIADVTAIKQKHTPGYPIAPNHKDFLFRAARAQANTNESIAIFCLFALFAVLSSADPDYLNAFSVLYFAGRLVHMLAYYARVALVRSIAFGVSLAGLAGMFVAGLNGWL